MDWLLKPRISKYKFLDIWSLSAFQPKLFYDSGVSQVTKNHQCFGFSQVVLYLCEHWETCLLTCCNYKGRGGSMLCFFFGSLRCTIVYTLPLEVPTCAAGDGSPGAFRALTVWDCHIRRASQYVFVQGVGSDILMFAVGASDQWCHQESRTSIRRIQQRARRWSGMQCKDSVLIIRSLLEQVPWAPSVLCLLLCLFLCP